MNVCVCTRFHVCVRLAVVQTWFPLLCLSFSSGQLICSARNVTATAAILSTHTFSSAPPFLSPFISRSTRLIFHSFFIYKHLSSISTTLSPTSQSSSFYLFFYLSCFLNTDSQCIFLSLPIRPYSIHISTSPFRLLIVYSSSLYVSSLPPPLLLFLQTKLSFTRSPLAKNVCLCLNKY